MKIHDKKLIQPYFDDVYYGNKTFEVRKNDCDYRISDLMVLREFDKNDNKYTGAFILTKIVYKLESFGVEKGYCILGIKILDRSNEKEECVEEIKKCIVDCINNIQPYKFEDLKVFMPVIDNKTSSLIVITSLVENKIYGFVFDKDKEKVYMDLINFEENRFFPMQMVNVRCE